MKKRTVYTTKIGQMTEEQMREFYRRNYLIIGVGQDDFIKTQKSKGFICDSPTKKIDALCLKCIGCECEDLSIIECNAFEEKKMGKEKFQMAEEQAREILHILTGKEKHGPAINSDMRKLREAGLIRKSELETLVEEAEKAIGDYQNLSGAEFKSKHSDFSFYRTLIDAFQALKNSYPDWNK